MRSQDTNCELDAGFRPAEVLVAAEQQVVNLRKTLRAIRSSGWDRDTDGLLDDAERYCGLAECLAKYGRGLDAEGSTQVMWRVERLLDEVHKLCDRVLASTSRGVGE